MKLSPTELAAEAAVKKENDAYQAQVNAVGADGERHKARQKAEREKAKTGPPVTLNLSKLDSLLVQADAHLAEVAKLGALENEAKAQIAEVLEDGRIDASETQKLAHARASLEILPASRARIESIGARIARDLAVEFEPLCRTWNKAVAEHRESVRGRAKEALRPFFAGAHEKMLERCVSSLWLPVLDQVARFTIHGGVPRADTPLTELLSGCRAAVTQIKRHAAEVGVTIADSASETK